MAFPILGLHRKSQANKVPFLMERVDTHNDSEHVIDIGGSTDASSSSSSHERPPSGLERQHSEDQASTSSRVPVYQPQLFSSGSNSRNSSLIRRGNTRGRQRSPLNSGLWISVELVLTVSQIIAAIIVLSLSRHEKPRAPLKAWIVGYASGCMAILPLLYWRFRYRNQGSEQDASQLRLDSSQGNNNASPLTRRVMEGEDRRTISTSTRGTQSNVLPNARYSQSLFLLPCLFVYIASLPCLTSAMFCSPILMSLMSSSGPQFDRRSKDIKTLLSSAIAFWKICSHSSIIPRG